MKPQVRFHTKKSLWRRLPDSPVYFVLWVQFSKTSYYKSGNIRYTSAFDPRKKVSYLFIRKRSLLLLSSETLTHDRNDLLVNYSLVPHTISET